MDELIGPDDLRSVQQELGLSNMQMARVLGIEDRSYRRLLAGERGISGPISRVIEALRDGWRPAGWPGSDGQENAERTNPSGQPS